jgi:hypothetical protein
MRINRQRECCARMPQPRWYANSRRLAADATNDRHTGTANIRIRTVRNHGVDARTTRAAIKGTASLLGEVGPPRRRRRVGLHRLNAFVGARLRLVPLGGNTQAQGPPHRRRRREAGPGSPLAGQSILVGAHIFELSRPSTVAACSCAMPFGRVGVHDSLSVTAGNSSDSVMGIGC